jgi:hypothetical protein
MSGVIRGMLQPGVRVSEGLKIGISMHAARSPTASPFPTKQGPWAEAYWKR